MAEKKPGRPKAADKEKPAPGAKRGRGARPADAAKDPEARLQELSEELFRLRFQFATRQLTNTSRIRTVRREVARVKTLQRQQQLAAQAGAKAAAKA